MCTSTQIAKTQFHSILSRKGWLSDKEKGFVRSLYQQSQRSGFVSLSEKQQAWLKHIAWKFEQTEKTHMATRCREKP